MGQAHKTIAFLVIATSLWIGCLPTASSEDTSRIRVKSRNTLVQIWDLSTSGTVVVDVSVNGSVVNQSLTLSKDGKISLHDVKLALKAGKNTVNVTVRESTNTVLSIPIRFPDYERGSPADATLTIDTKKSMSAAIDIWAPKPDRLYWGR